MKGQGGRVEDVVQLKKKTKTAGIKDIYVSSYFVEKTTQKFLNNGL